MKVYVLMTSGSGGIEEVHGVLLHEEIAQTWCEGGDGRTYETFELDVVVGENHDAKVELAW